VELTGELLMQLTLELLSDPDVKECVNRVMVNECGRVAELVFEQVKSLTLD
jgi:hypothetical protein